MSKPVEPMGQFKMLSAEALSRGIELLRHGGREGIDLFMTTATEVLAADGEDALQSWLTIASPALPESERTVVFTALFSSIFSENCSIQRAPDATLH